MNRNLALEFVRVTEMAAIASARTMGRGDEKLADQAAVDAARKMLDSVECNATIVIGEGERDEAPMLYIGEKVGSGVGPELEIAVDPLEGTSVCARGQENSISVMAIAEKGGLLNAPDTYMQKIAVGPEGKGVIDIKESPLENLKRLAEVKKCRVQDLTAIILDRPRHMELIEEVRAAGARIQLIGDGDVAAALACCDSNSGVDILMGIGGAPEGVIAAAAMRCMGGDFQGILKPRNNEEIERAKVMGIEDITRVFHMQDLASGNVLFCATGVTDGTFLRGVKFKSWGAVTHSMVMRSQSGTIRRIEAEHHFDKKPRY
ncbi:MAG: fructose-bisphosphatase class II [Bdellovibrionales bacterium CG12_big_fil_rev_8_21_14_0_65_38_15]|nr:MAG: fructose-bisphosphatase class II [Bdellovibrionales bacterium CG22_combo_CG10-13_8_21_14_all_38_13]PIQ54388.1 MAG: fructose-bisphosphatase class II [Bdellovibrionales bacterium CG12_big_fil_rev_8_21_14_0_65_38_15]